VPGDFDDLLDANAGWRDGFGLAGLSGTPVKHLAVVSCMDTRVDPLGALGLQPGDAKILRNAGARVTDDVIRSIAIVVANLGVARVAVVAHTDCAMAKSTAEELRQSVAAIAPGELGDWDPLAVDDQAATLRSDLDRLRTSPLLPDDLVVAGFLYDVSDGSLTPIG
jgi:carbonic anhydrase